MKGVKIRKATMKDINEVQKMSGADELKNPDGKPQKKWWFEAFIKEKQFFYVAQADSNLVGFIVAERTVGDCILIQDIFIKKDFRGKGVGHLLINTLEREAKKKKVRAFYAYSDVKKETVNFYKKLKYEPSHLVQEVLKFLK